MRSPYALLSVVALAATALLPACTEKIIKKQVEAPAPDETAAEETPPEETPPAPEEKPTPSSGAFLDLGEAPVGQDVSFTIPPGTLGFNITAEGDVADFNQSAPFGIERITDPSGNVVHDDFTPKGGTKPTSVAAFDTIAVASVPQSESVPEKIPTGTWKVRYGIQGSDGFKPKLRGKVRLQTTSDGAFYGGKLDLHVYVPPGLVLKDNGAQKKVDANNAKADASLAKRIDTYYALAGQLLGIERGAVTFHVAPTELSAIDGVQELLQGFAVSGGTQDGAQSMHILFTNQIADQGQAFALGISPGIPGAATLYGRGVSGIIVAGAESADEDAITMFHETGHFIGLNHTTEFDGQSSDPLTDTPRCTTIANRDLYSCPDRANIMFPAGAIASPVSLSATQKRVYRGSPVYKAYASATQKTMAFTAPRELATPTYHATGRALSVFEQQLAMGRCGLTKIDANVLVQRFGRADAVAQLRAIAADPAFVPFMRGRANLALKDLGETP